MAVVLGQRFGVDFAGLPAHMSAIDFVLWQRYKRQAPLVASGLYFDVSVGEGVDVGQAVDPGVARAWSRLTAHRIDVVEEHADHWVILELRGAAGPGAIGSLVVYRSLWQVGPPDDRRVDLVLVTDTFSDNLRSSLVAQGIRLILV